ncbi:bifunctional 5,10-methylenetetrahydrofolate dehydrogenase/5,10-methenyltetrahydrofolate cyclohydrolase [Fervidobacterium sp. 2310opik-2]|uniref:bifunctional 5,10-methylenetetrahydrofolate dehydrogenase/5,10-methenyltetrahydrofolate cyclohydrolase n=1 Tax=Fervidobacterium sp. 2310opik-2 TaxID=1755815 RepID=UPI0013DF8404|nr:bifunctional 5,10-methylenetetrahydrofolate dehydrogenase/5,10-methenyltetrahydrofolate cyclohydrolase [Fervidobacterium sp. 2310opik-2]KAF2961113.1 bifunctional 5,10-methylene-tetrahydrofolate dehydrogenase/5,10-methylene-tetrahydrofolate cyclohydrolase [Fervidobacterium sp. 2310opik-2]
MFINIEPLYSSMVENIKERVSKLSKPPKLVAVTCQPDSSTLAYLRSQEKQAKRFGIDFAVYEAPKAMDLKILLPKLSADGSVNGIFLTHPLPSDISEYEAVSLISPDKDIEGRHPINLGNILYDKPVFPPCTAEAVLRIINYLTNPSGKKIAVIGRSVTVGKPLAMLLLQKGVDATVTVCHSRTKDIAEITKNSDIVVVAIGKAKMFGKDYFKPGTIVIDVGINVEGDEIVGDVDPSVSEICELTPVPGGVGRITTLVLMEHTVKAAEMSLK